ncbi:hypothetical protein ACJVDH_15520 [Pedobacter sp. AW1-32]|uniref:hypothetical protein n=1 Tax=Pedobacter sp. AW1-32 TaxID=3383026 RepID=UPI003FEDC8C2
MPANKKHLTRSPWLRLVKILTGAIGGYAVMFSFHLLLTKIFPAKDVVVTAFISGYILWAVLLLMAFIARNVWKILALYFLITLALTGLYLIV